LLPHCKLSMTEEQAAKYINSLKYFIQERVILHDVFSVDENHNKALKIESLQSKTLLFKSPTPIDETTTEAPAAAPATIAAPVVKGKENLYANLGASKYHRCGKPEYKSNECPKRKQVNIVDYEDEELEINPDDSEFAEEYGESATCVIQRLLCNQNTQT